VEATLSPAILAELRAIEELYDSDFWFLAADRLEKLLEENPDAVQKEESALSEPPSPSPLPCPISMDTSNSSPPPSTSPPPPSSSSSSSSSSPPPPPPPPSISLGGPHSKLSRTHRINTELKQVMKEFETTDGWEPKWNALSDDDIWYRLENDGSHSFRVEGFIDAPLFNLLSLVRVCSPPVYFSNAHFFLLYSRFLSFFLSLSLSLFVSLQVYEFDLFPLWFPLLKSASEVATPSRFSKFARIVAWAPWPMSDRECVLRGYGDIFKGDSVAIFAKDAHPNDFLGTSCEGNVEFPKEGENGTCRMNVHKCAFHFIPVVDEETLMSAAEEEKDVAKEVATHTSSSDDLETNGSGETKTDNSKKNTNSEQQKNVGAGGRVLCKVFFNIDLKVALLPDALLNLIIGKFCGVILMLVRKHAHPSKMIGSKYEERITNNPEVYAEMKRRITKTKTDDAIQRNIDKYATDRQKEILSKLPDVTV